MKHQEGDVELPRCLPGGLHHISQGRQEAEGVLCDMVGICGCLLLVNGVFGDPDLILAREAFQRDPCLWEEKPRDVDC